jgi:hypothetical protein
MHEQKQWYSWVKKVHEEEEEHGESESKKVKLESLLFNRHQKELARHQRDMKSRESKKQQEEFLDKVYTERLSEVSEEEQGDWDPIKDIYIDLVIFFLILEDDSPSKEVDDMPEMIEDVHKSAPTSDGKTLSKSAKK